ncbi:MAG: putative transrane protein [Chloroflexi bacterium]|nr:putative transrane protein [Chloroflexota bacterium]
MTTATLSPFSETRTYPAPLVLWAILGVVLIADIMDLLDSTLTNIAAPSVVRDLGGGVSLIKWLGSSYTLAMGVLLVVGGRLGDKYGQRRLFLIGQAGFTLASAVCGLSVSPGMIVVARLVQGAFGALLIPQGMAIVTATFPNSFRAKAFSAFGPALGVAMIAGPPFGGFIITANIAGLGWRAMFLINIVIGTLGLFAALRFLPKLPGDGSISVDGVGAVTLGGTMVGLMYGLIDASTNGWNVLPIGCMVVGLACFSLFCSRQVTSAHPLIKPTLLKNRGFTAGLLLGLFYFAVVSGLMYVLSLFLQEGLGRSAGAAAIEFVPLTLGIVLSSVAGAQLIPKLGRTLSFIGVLLTVAGTGGFLAGVLAAGLMVSSWAVEPAMLVIGLGMGLCFGTLFDAALSAISPDEAGSASGSISAIQQLAGCIGSAVITSVFFQVLPASSYVRALELSLTVVIGIAAICCGLVWLLPARIRAESSSMPA